LPGLLRGLGYRNVDISVRHYADAYDLNLLRSFQQANGRRPESGLPITALAPLIGHDGAYFLGQVAERISTRLAFLLSGQAMDDAFAQVTQSEEVAGDPGRLRELFNFIDADTGPFFAHVHLMGTHGKRYSAETVAQFDTYVRQVYDFLQQRELLENTILVIHTDHGHSYAVHRRVPLIFRFPGRRHAGHRSVNIQNLDIAPTLLDELGLDIPPWMEGDSILSAPLAERLYLFNTAGLPGATTATKGKGRRVDPKRISPPFFSLGVVSVVHCQEVHRFHLHKNRIRTRESPGHTAPCPADQLIDDEMVRQLVLSHLADRGYDVDHLRASSL
jgi:hypothetical protein